ncbi:origin recognition complex subunit 4-like isoform X2 [Lineus longissimus]
MLLKSCLDELHADKEATHNLLEVHLNGLLQTDDKIALKEITRQLQLENVVGDKVFGSFAENLQFLLDALKSGDQDTKSVLFILDEFDLFSSHKNQTLLYNLFDTSQSAQTPVCIVGLTCRLDVVELLEKRVKSRFSHRQIYLFNTFKYEDYVEIFYAYLTLPEDFSSKSFMRAWNKQILDLIEDKTVQDVLKRQFHFSKDFRSLQTLLLIPLCQLSAEHPYLEPANIKKAAKHLKQDSKTAMLHGISILELCLIIAMKHLNDIYHGEPFNFEMVYNEYQKFAQKRSSMQMFERAVVLKAFEHLLALEFVRPMDGGGSRMQKEYRLMTLLFDNAQINDALQKYHGCPTEIKQWAQSALA